jgi:hypothetical protein
MLHPEIKNFSDYIITHQNELTSVEFSKEFGKLTKKCCKSQCERDEFCTQADILAASLEKGQHNDFASMIMSTLCKVAEFMPEKLEEFAQKGYEIAKTNGDCVHMMARLNNLRKLYFRKPNKLNKYVEVFYKQEECLKELTSNYKQATKSYHSIFRRPATKNEYENMLAYVQTEIGKLIKKKHPEEAQEKLLSARAIFAKGENYESVVYIDMLLKEIQTTLAKHST